MRGSLVQVVPRGQLARVRGESALDIGPDVAGRPREARSEVGMTGRKGAMSRERGLGRGRSRRRESQLVEAFTQSILEGHGGGLGRKPGSAVGLSFIQASQNGLQTFQAGQIGVDEAMSRKTAVLQLIWEPAAQGTLGDEVGGGWRCAPWGSGEISRGSWAV